MLNIVLFGPPGAGKGTQSQFLIEKYQLTHLSTGDLFRFEMSNGTPLGLKAKEYMNQGVLVPDAVVIGMIENKIKSSTDSKGYIFDGFPRTVPQAEALDLLMNGLNMPISGMIALEVPEKELVTRLLLRGKDSGRADDQNEELIAKRIQEYESKTVPVAGFYANQSKYAGINGVGSIDDITHQISAIIEKY